MKAISLWQPWASLWACSRKGYETRSWATKHRGPIAIHAAQKLCADVSEELVEICRDEFGSDWQRQLPRGALIATTHLNACLPTQSLRTLVSEEELLLGDFSDGRYAWHVDPTSLLPRAICFRGRQSLFNVPDELVI